MKRLKLIEVGEFYKITLKNKWLIKARKDIDYDKTNYIGKILVDENGNRIGKILDVIGNTNNPYILVYPLKDTELKGKIFVEIIEKKRRR